MREQETSLRRRASGLIRRTPLHPQWLLGNALAGERQVADIVSGAVLDIGSASRWPEGRLPDKCHYVALDYPATGADLYQSTPDLFADAAALPIADQAFDHVLLLEVIEHLRQPQECLVEIARVLKPGGSLIMSSPFLYPIHDAPFDFQRLTRHGLLRDVEAAGLRIESIAPRLNSTESAALLSCLALAGSAVEILKTPGPRWLLIPLVVVAVTAINLGAKLVGWLLPSWTAMSNGYELLARKP